MATILSGLVGGLLGAIASAALRRAAGDEPAPSATVWAMYFGDGEPEHYALQGAVVHVLYGALAGGLFALSAGSLSLGLATAADALLWAVVWAAVLAVIAVGFWGMVLIGETPDPRGVAELGAVHLAFAVVLGLFVYLAPTL